MTRETLHRSSAEKQDRTNAAEDARSRSLLSVLDLELKEIEEILKLGSQLEAEEPLVRATRLAKRRVALLFYEASTRTRTSFELAAKGLGADTALISSLSSSIEKGESLKDTGITLRALGAECIILRHLSSGAPYLLQQATGLPVLNAGDGMHEHPSQALLDLKTILESLGKSAQIHDHTLAGITVCITGDILHSRVARSNALLLPRLGARVILCGPPALLPDTAAQIAAGIEIERDFDRALAASNVVMMLRIQKERLSGLQIDLEDYVARYQLHQDRLTSKAPKAVVMHPGPMIRGLEITSEVADGTRSVIAQQVTNGVSVRMALVHRALGSEKHISSPGEGEIKKIDTARSTVSHGQTVIAAPSRAKSGRQKSSRSAGKPGKRGKGE